MSYFKSGCHPKNGTILENDGSHLEKGDLEKGNYVGIPDGLKSKLVIPIKFSLDCISLSFAA